MSIFFYKKEEPLSPSGIVIIDEKYRRGKINYKIRLNGYCTWCNIEVLKPKRNWCGKECVEKYNLTQPKHLKKIIKKRDKAFCKLCNKKCSKKSEFDLDHIIPISMQGHPFDLNNLRILCIECHKKETKRIIYESCSI